ncbi:MAG TPA: HAMP domain-containing sensor histidine kinase [bacterium]|nr:HAMP domain-containing sensor histidine kinase [bacterium]
MNIKIIATEFFAGLLVLTYLTSVIQSENLTIFLVRIFLFMVSVVVALLLIRSVYGEVKRREEMEQLTKKLQKTTSDLKFANKELMRLDDVKSEFLSIASHQLRTPSTAVKGYTSMILEGSFGKISKPVKESMEKVFLANERLLNLVESLLNISRIEAGREDLDIKPVDMAAIVKPIIEDFGIKAKEKKLKLSMEVEPRLPKAAGDASKIKEVVSNIIDNSLKYTNEGEIMINLHQESQSIVFACQDTGIGIEPDDLPRLFNKFVRGKGMMQVHTEGTGLGIYYARLLVESMGGRIWAESPGKNKGAKFSFSLPMADKSKARRVKSG